MTPVLMGAWLLGILLGFRHAFEPDHLSAVATLVNERNDRRAGLWVGAIWGVGHTLSLLVVAGILAALQIPIPPRVEGMLELGVGAMLFILGARSIVRARREGSEGWVGEHQHGKNTHLHLGPEHHVHLGRMSYARGPLLIGIVHGLAGSGALMALAMSAMPTAASRAAYVAVFGVGSTLGMAMLTGLLGLPLQRLQTHPYARSVVSLLAGVLAVGVGGYWSLAAIRSLAL